MRPRLRCFEMPRNIIILRHLPPMLFCPSHHCHRHATMMPITAPPSPLIILDCPSMTPAHATTYAYDDDAKTPMMPLLIIWRTVMSVVTMMFAFDVLMMMMRYAMAF